MSLGYTDKEQFFEAYSADPVLYAEIDSTRAFSSVDYTVAITSLVLEDNGGNLTAVWGDALGFGDLVEVVSEDLQPNAASIVLDAFTFTSSLLGQWVRITLGSTILRTDQHVELYVGQIVAEDRSSGEYSLSIQEGVYLQLLKKWLPGYQIKDQAAFVAAAPADSQDKYVPIVVGDLAQIAGSDGRIRAIAITNNSPAASNDFLVCETAFGDAYTVSAVYKNGTSVGVVAAEVNGATYDYIKVTVNPSEPDDDITVDISRLDPTAPMTELQDFLISNGLDINTLDTASFTAAEVVASARNYRLGGKITEPTQMLGIVSDWLRSFSARAVFSGGQMGVKIRDYVMDFAAPDFTEAGDILKDSASASSGIDGIINRLTYSAGFDPDGTALILGIEQDAASITTWSERERSIVLPWAANSVTAKDVAQRMVFDYKEPRAIITFRTGLRASFDNLDILDDVRVTAASSFVRRFCEIIRRTFSGSNFNIGIEALDIDDLVQQAFRLGAEESLAADAPHDLPLNDPRNCSVTGAIDDGGTLTTGAGTDTLTRAGGVSFVTRGVLVGDFVTLFQLAASGTPVNIGTYEIYEGVLAIGDPITTAGVLTVEDPNTGAAVAFTGAEVITYWWIARSWATANADQRRQGYITKADGTMSDGSAGKVLV
jgi:hypothetical protein